MKCHFRGNEINCFATKLSKSFYECMKKRCKVSEFRVNANVWVIHTILTGSWAWSAGWTSAWECNADGISVNDNGWWAQPSCAPENKAAPNSTLIKYILCQNYFYLTNRLISDWLTYAQLMDALQAQGVWRLPEVMIVALVYSLLCCFLRIRDE